MGLYPHLWFVSSLLLAIPSLLPFTLLPFLYPATLCVNAGFYLGAGNSPISSIAFPWLLSIEAFAGARLVLNLHALSFDVSTDSSGSRSGVGTLSSHIVFTTNPSAANHPRAPSVRWDWGGPQGNSHDGSRSRSGDGTGTGTRIGTETIAENYEMTWAGASTSDPDASFHRKHRAGKSASTSATNCTSRHTHSDTCAEIEDEGMV